MMNMVKTKEDLIGKQFGLLTVIEQTDDYVSPRGKHLARYKCICQCGNPNKIVVLKNSLTTGNTQSCGCIKSEAIRKSQWMSHKKYNEYRFDGNIVIGICSNSNKEFMVDLENFDKIKDICWCLQEKTKSGEIDRLVGWDTDTKKLVRMHVYLGYKNYDHIDCNELNNTIANLRPANASQNKINSKNRDIGKSGFRGVWLTSNRKYYAGIQFTTNINGVKKKHRITSTARDNPEDAYIDYLRLSLQYHQNYSSVLDDCYKYGIITEEEFLKMLEG